MSLLEEIKALTGGYNGVNRWTVEDEIDDVECLEDEILDTGRWTIRSRAIFRRGYELVGLSYESPATEYQDGGDFDWSVYPVKAVQVTVTRYEKV